MKVYIYYETMCMTTHGRKVNIYCGMPDTFSTRYSVMVKKNYFHFYLVSKYKKSQDSYTNYLWDHAKQFRVYTTIIPPSFPSPLFCCFRQLFDRKLNGTCLVGNFYLFIIKHTQPQQQISRTVCYFASAR